MEAEKSLSASVESKLRPSGFQARGSREGFVGGESVGRCDAGAPDGDGWS